MGMKNDKEKHFLHVLGAERCKRPSNDVQQLVSLRIMGESRVSNCKPCKSKTASQLTFQKPWTKRIWNIRTVYKTPKAHNSRHHCRAMLGWHRDHRQQLKGVQANGVCPVPIESQRKGLQCRHRVVPIRVKFLRQVLVVFPIAFQVLSPKQQVQGNFKSPTPPSLDHKAKQLQGFQQASCKTSLQL